MSARRAGSVVWALEPGRRVGLVTSELSPKMAESSNTRWSGVVWSPSVRSPRDADDSGLSTEAWLIPPPFRPHTPRRPARGETRAQDPAVPAADDDVIYAEEVACVRGVQSLGRSIDAIGEDGRSWHRSSGLVMLAAAPATSAVAGEVTLTTPFPAIAVAPGSAPSFEISVTTAGARPRRPVGRQRARPAGPRSCAAAASPSTGSSPTARTATDGHAQRDGPGRRRRRHRSGSPSAARSPAASTTLPVDIRVAPNAAGDVTLTTDIAAAQGRLGRVLPVQPHADQRHPRGPPVQRRGHRAGRLDGDRPGRVAGPGRQRRGQGRQHLDRSRSPPRPSAGDRRRELPDRGRRDERQPIGARRTSRSRSPGATSSRSRPADQRLNLSATAGSVSDMTLTLTNTGTADVEGAAMSRHGADAAGRSSSTPPTVTVPAGQSVQVVAHVTPSADAIAGDYVDDIQGDGTGRQRRRPMSGSRSRRRCCGASSGSG